MSGRMFEERAISVFVNPRELREWADAMEENMKDSRIGSTVWNETIGTEGNVRVRLYADQEWFHRRKDGIPDWDAMLPDERSLARFKVVENEEREFPATYSGQAWRAAFRLWKATVEHGVEILYCDPYSTPKGVDYKGLDLTGFMEGWARNAVRQMLGLKPGSNPAVLEIGAGDAQPVVPASGPAGSDLKRVLGGS